MLKIMGWQWCTELRLTHSSHMFQILLTIVQLRKRWLVDSSSPLHISQRTFLILTLLLTKFALVWILFKSILHPNNWALGRVCKLQSVLNVSLFSPSKVSAEPNKQTYKKICHPLHHPKVLCPYNLFYVL